MRHLAKLLVPLAAIGVVLAGTPDPASAKCSRSMGTVLPDVLYLLDGAVIDRGAFDGLDPDDIFSIQVTCHEVTPGDANTRVLQNAVAVLSRSGAAAVMEARLRDLVEAQRAHFAAAGSYAATLEELDFPDIPAGHAIRISASETGWSASSGSARLGTECHVAMGSAAGQPDQSPRVVRCREVGEG
jgi:hypothetical protein